MTAAAKRVEHGAVMGKDMVDDHDDLHSVIRHAIENSLSTPALRLYFSVMASLLTLAVTYYLLRDWFNSTKWILHMILELRESDPHLNIYAVTLVTIELSLVAMIVLMYSLATREHEDIDNVIAIGAIKGSQSSGRAGRRRAD
jgi:hypothetical protein